MEEEREINHHGEVRPVPTTMTIDDNDPIMQSFNKVSFHILKQDQYLIMQDLISPNEILQDAALKEYYKNVEKNNLEKQKYVLKRYLFIAHHINPTVAVWFVSCYWIAGMLHYFMFGFGTVLTTIILTTIFFVVAFVFYFCCLGKMKSGVNNGGTRAPLN